MQYTLSQGKNDWNHIFRKKKKKKKKGNCWMTRQAFLPLPQLIENHDLNTKNKQHQPNQKSKQNKNAMTLI